jgi:hypothetical protein
LLPSGCGYNLSFAALSEYFSAARGTGVSAVNDYCELLNYTDAQFSRVDPLVMNLLVARGLPGLDSLDIVRYERMADSWAKEMLRRLPAQEEYFYRTPSNWRNDLRFFRLGMLCQYVDEVLGVRYREDHKAAQTGRPPEGFPSYCNWALYYSPLLSYADPATLFLHGVMDSRRGTCANMAALLVALAWRLGWSLSLACSGSHVLARYDDGEVRYNIEATNMGGGGFSAPSDEHYIKEDGIALGDISRGSDLTALRPRQVLGLFIGLGGRYYQDTGNYAQAREEYQLALQLYPQSRFFARKVYEVGGRASYSYY